VGGGGGAGAPAPPPVVLARRPRTRRLSSWRCWPGASIYQYLHPHTSIPHIRVKLVAIAVSSIRIAKVVRPTRITLMEDYNYNS
jgi:hypothetical protein